jgi:tape measure domain-containing protein
MASILETFFILFQTDAKRVQGEIEDADRAAVKLAGDIDRAGKALPPGQLNEANRALGAAGRAARELDHELDDAGRAADRVGDEVKRTNRELREAERNAAALGASFGNIVGRVVAIAGAYLGGREIVAYADEYKSLASQIRLTAKTSEEFQAAQTGIFNIAQSTRQALTGTTSLYASLQRSTESLGYSQERLLGVTKTINQAITISGTSASAAEAALVQLGQGFASGTLRGEELNSVLEQAPRLAKAIAEGMGVTVGELRQLGQDGKITADAVFKALEGQGAAIAAEFGTMGTTVGQSLTVLRNASVKFVGELDTALGASERLARGITGLATGLGTLFDWLQRNRGLVQGFAIGLSAALAVVAAALWGSYIPAWWAAATATIAATWPILAIIAAVLAAAAAFALLWEDVQAFLNGQPSLLGDLVNRYTFVREAVEFIGEAFRVLQRVGAAVWAALTDAAEAAGPVFMAVLGIVGDVFRGIWSVAGPILSLLWDAIQLWGRINATVWRGIFAVAAEVFNALAPLVMPILRGIGEIVQWLGGVFATVAKAIWGEWGAMFGRFVERLQFVIGLVRSLMGFAENVRKGVDAAIDKVSGGAQARQAVRAGQGQLATAGASPLAAQTPASVAAGARTSTRSTSVQVGKVEVHTQATDAEGMARAAGGALSSQLRRTTAQYDDGVDR